MTDIPVLEELDPITFCNIWGLTYEVAADYLQVGYKTLIAYNCNPQKATHRNPSARVRALAALVHNQWIREGRIPVRSPLSPPKAEIKGRLR